MWFGLHRCWSQNAVRIVGVLVQQVADGDALDSETTGNIISAKRSAGCNEFNLLQLQCEPTLSIQLRRVRHDNSSTVEPNCDLKATNPLSRVT
jgi:hypothetical protein